MNGTDRITDFPQHFNALALALGSPVRIAGTDLIADLPAKLHALAESIA